jgi:hypothetical protein|nr:MAG TPA: hypothetical protein [Caudoviricetes sp.]
MDEFDEILNEVMIKSDDQKLEKLYKRIAEPGEENDILQEKIDRLSLLLTKKMDI